MGAPVVVVPTPQWCGARGVVTAEVQDLALDSAHRTEDGIAGDPMRYPFVAHGVFLVGVDHRDGPSGFHGFQG